MSSFISWVKSNKALSVALAVILVGAVYVVNDKTDFFEKLAKRDSVQQLTGVSVASASEIHSDCEGKTEPSEKFDCYGAAFETYMKAEGGRKTLELLQALNDLGGYAQFNCHPLSHKVGNIALHVYGTIPNAAPQYIPTCHSGFYHGLLEEYLATAPSYEQGVKEACGDPNKEIYFNWFQCVHGTGHGVMQFRDNELPQALGDCDLLPAEKQAKEICYGGAFMENITTDEKTGHPAKYIKQEDPIYPCNGKEFAERYRASCYFLASSQILKINGYNMRDAFEKCASVEANYRWLCFQSLGRDVSGSTLRNNDRVIEQCQYAARPEDAGNCFYGAVRDYINEKGQFETGLALCAQVPDAHKQRCYDAVILDMSFYKRGQEYLDLCGKMPEPYLSQCRRSSPS